MNFIVVQIAAPTIIMSWLRFRATCVTDDRTVDVFFAALCMRHAKTLVRNRYPSATFSDELKGGKSAVVLSSNR